MTTNTVDRAVRDAADQLLRAAATRTPCPPVRGVLPAGSGVPAGYAVQSLLTRARLDAGAVRVGRKIGLTSPAVQAQLGVDQPDFGVLFDDMECGPQTPIDIGRVLQPRIEAEIAFVLGADLDGDEVDDRAARAAVAAVVPALEIVDSRIANWDITILDTVCDNASSGLFVLGGERRPLGDTDLRLVEMTMTDGAGEIVSRGRGADCLGDPVTALTWLARTAARLGDPLRAGEVVLSGALGPMRPVVPGDRFTATLSGIGEVGAHFSPTTGGPS